jgi:hypothetical protein
MITVRAPAPPTEEHTARSNKAPGTTDTTALPRSEMSRRSPDPTSCAATASAHVGQGHHTRVAVSHTQTPRPPPLTRRPLPCRALIEAAHNAIRCHPPYRALADRQRARLGRQRGGSVAAITIARKLPEASWWVLTRNRPFAPAGARVPLTA